MKPLNLQGHSRPIKKVLFSDNGELLFTASADRNIISWFTTNGEKFKTYTHSASVNTLTLSPNENTYMISGDNTGCTYIWDVKGGVLMKKIEHDPILSVRSLDLLDFSFLLVVYAGRTKLAQSFINIYKFDQIMGIGVSNRNSISYINGKTGNSKFYEADSIYSMPSKTNSISNEQIIPFKHFECMTNTSTKYSNAKFVSFSINENVKNVLASREDGCMEMINMTTGKLIFENKFHEDAIIDFDHYREKNLILTASRDGTACLFNLDSLDIITVFKPENPIRNLNACKVCLYLPTEDVITSTIADNFNKLDLNFLSGKNTNEMKIDVNALFDIPTKENPPSPSVLAIVAGGQESKLVTTSKQEGGFEVIAYDSTAFSSSATQTFSLNAHFGPVNSIAYSIKKKLLASGSEDSSAKIYLIDKKLFS